ncbi:hypothetical protein [Burkholderia sp. S171]|uniref:hypothetical protein n=1 Tax=Burkholderia sp. S171 TaxID=1641860 RepID=UPI0020B14ACA|nr:hypothetical protein [Burkholderia sp. S171]
MKSALRRILAESARLNVPADSLADDAGLDPSLDAAGSPSRGLLRSDTPTHISAGIEALS